uniref:Condensation domain-containing protein n=1 Tax=Ditylum brightwellii TaxID=49249 RepID=A0A7S4QK39_9STRA
MVIMNKAMAWMAFSCMCPILVLKQVESFSITKPIAKMNQIPMRNSAAIVAGGIRMSTETAGDIGTASTSTDGSSKGDADLSSVTRRSLGSQENLMLPRQYGPHLDKKESPFPQMNHVSVAVLSSTPSLKHLQSALNDLMKTHPLLRCHIEGSGEPEKRIDLFQMVREGEPDPCTFVSSDQIYDVDDVLTVKEVSGDTNADLDNSWKSSFESSLDDGSWCDVNKGPLWNIELHRTSSDASSPCALLMKFNHAISDQSSANLMLDQILYTLASLDERGSIKDAATVPQSMPLSLEESVLGTKRAFKDVKTEDVSLNTVKYVLAKAAEGSKSPVILPDSITGSNEDGGGILGALTIISGRSPGGDGSSGRKSTVQFRKLSDSNTQALLAKCRANGVSITNALTAAAALTSTDFIDGGSSKKDMKRNYKVLQSLDMRRFGDQLDKCETVSCKAGSMDLMLGPLDDYSGESIRLQGDVDLENKFWDLAKTSRDQTSDFIQNDGPQEATRVFDFAMTISDMNNLVHLSAEGKDTQGRAYSAGVSNVGVYERQKGVRRNSNADGERDTIKSKHGKYEVQEIYFATSHARSGCLYQVSTMTVQGSMDFTFHPASPIVPKDVNAKYADAFIDLLELVSGGERTNPTSTKNENKGNMIMNFAQSNPLDNIPEWSLGTVAAALGLVGIAIHWDAWVQFIDNFKIIRQAVPDDADFWSVLNFWILFAVSHPILQPILWISDVLHGSPGPKIADLVPATFLLGNVVAISAVAMSKEIRNAAGIFALSAFITYVGAGLDGQAGLGDFNLQLNDSYKGTVVKGCPTYEQVRQPSMDNFDLEKYQGLWYEQKFHDWTQFKEVYDTYLDIKLTSDGKGWIDDFGVRGPAPASAKLSWDKSPVANGAHYFMFGRVDEKDPPGILRESGFGVEFPNYIVDVQKDPETGE